MPGRLVATAVIAALVIVAGCARLSPPEPVPAYFTQVTDEGWLYAHNWGNGIPCFTMELLGENWMLARSSPSQVEWMRGEEFLSVIFSDNRRAGFAVAGMLPEDVLRAFLGYEAEHIRPLFDFQVIHQPRFTNEYDGTWMGWGWEGKGGKRRGVKSTVPADQSHVIMSLWLDPYVMSFDWGSKTTTGRREPTLEMIMLLETLEFRPDCFDARLHPAKPRIGKPYKGTDYVDETGTYRSDGFDSRRAVPRSN